MLRGNIRSRIGLRRPTPASTPLRAGGIRRKLLLFLVLVVVVVALLPTIIAKTPLRNVLLSAAMPSNAVRVSIGGASLSWISGPTLSGVQINDAAGNTLLTADSISADRAPINLLLNSHDLGAIRINRPEILLKVRPDGSNLEDALQQLVVDLSKNAKPPSAKQSPGSQFAFALQLVDGTILAEDVATGRVCRIEGVNLQYDCHGSGGGIGNGSLAGQIAIAGPRGAAPTPAGRFAMMLKPSDGRNELTIQTQGIALAALQPWINRVAAGSELSGTLSGNGTATWTSNANNVNSDFTTAGAVTIDQLDATTAALQGDRVRLAHVELPWRLVTQPAGLAIDDLQLKSDVAQVAVRGRLDPALLTKPQNTNVGSLLLSGSNNVELHGTIDLARLATMLPRTLRIRNDTTITSGSIELAGRIQPTATGESLSGALKTSQLAATSGGRPFRWDDPISANFALRRENGTLTLDALQCNSKFLRVQAAGTFQKLSANASFDLNSLADQLGQFIDVTQLQLAGTGTLQLSWQQTESDRFSASTTGDLSQLRVTLSDGAVWAEPQLALRAEAAGLLDPLSHYPTRIDTGQIQVTGQGDQLDARLTEPVALTNAAPEWTAAVHSTGSIARWLIRARPWIAPGSWQINGASEITATVRATSNSIDVADAKIVINNLQAASLGWNINEPRVELAGDAQVNRGTGQMAANSVQLVTSTISLAAKDIHYASGDHGINQLAGAAAFRADLARLAAWRAPSNSPTEYQPAGEFTGNIRFAQQSGRITGDITAAGQNLLLTSNANRNSPANRVGPGNSGAPANQIIWQEPRLTLHATTNYDSTADRLTFEQFQIQSNTLQANAAGRIERLSTVAECNINGALDYDLAQVSPLLRPYIGEGIQLNGREQARFALAGELLHPGGVQLEPVSFSGQPAIRNQQSASNWSRRIHAQFELPWGGANVYGLPVGPGKLAAKLGDGALQITPIVLTVGEGQLRLAPNIRFDPHPAELTMPAGPVITNVRISPEVSEAMLKFVAPVLAGATQSDGQFSLQLDGLRMPLAAPKKTDSAGKLTVHSVRVVPGPTTQPWVNLAQQVEALVKHRDPSANRQPASLLSVHDQQVNFRVVDGRVYHQNIEFQVGDVVMRSQGSVGLDETISLTLQIPVQDAWIAKEPLLAGLRGQSLQIPVTGTLKRPQMDQRAIASLSSQLIQKAAGQAVGNELNKALDKLLKPRQ